MLFNTYNFIFYFLPVTLVVFILFFVAGKKNIALGWLAFASLYFYAQWSLWGLPLLLASIGVNFYLGKQIGAGQPFALCSGICLNLLVLGCFKYANFLSALLGGGRVMEVDLPLAISFFTFQQIAYLVDIHRKTIAPLKFGNYALFVSFFPHLIAGPIMHYREMVPQFSSLSITRTHLKTCALGVVFFSIGLFKKVVLADNFAPISDAAFAAAKSRSLDIWQAWQGMFAYTFQIYFDFSGYAEMAIGLGLLFGIWLPINFNSPYKSSGITVFWRRWHMTLSGFLRDYLYIPLGGNRSGKWRQANNLLVTMLLAGLWHGAGLTFILWGGLHGLLLIIDHHLPKIENNRYWKVISVLLTFLLVSALWVVFRAESLTVAQDYFHALMAYPDTPMQFAGKNLSVLFWLLAGFIVIWIFPGTIQWLNYDYRLRASAAIKLHAGHGLLAGILLFVSLKMMANGPSQSFIYFVF